MNKMAVLLLAALTTSCQLSLVNEPVSVKELLPVGSRLVLSQAIDIPQDRASIYIFRGKVVSYNEVDIYYPHCQFRLYKVSSQARQVVPDTFEITKVVEWEDYVRNEIRRVAGLDKAVADVSIQGRVGVGAGVDDGGPSLIKYATILSLRSTRQPAVKELVCLHWGDQGDVKPVTLEEMKSALGNVFTVSYRRSENPG